MNESTFQRKQLQFLTSVWPQRVVRLDQLQYAGSNVFRMGDLELPATAEFVDSFDRLIGLNARQKQAVREASGEEGLTNFRNYLDVADNISEAKRVVLVASPKTRQLVSVRALANRYIPPQLFFEFAEIVADETGFDIYEMRYSTQADPRITISFSNPHSHPLNLGRGEDFLTDGIFIEWRPEVVRLGHYYVRLVCTNGQTVRDTHRDYSLYQLGTDDIRKIKELLKGKEFFAAGVEEFASLMRTAERTRISLSEMGKAHNALLSAGVAPQLANDLLHYPDAVKAYQERNLYCKGDERQLVGPTTIWDAYNELTAFATHTDLWAPHDIRRADVANAAWRLLSKEPDIQTYCNIFE